MVNSWNFEKESAQKSFTRLFRQIYTALRKTRTDKNFAYFFNCWLSNLFSTLTKTSIFNYEKTHHHGLRASVDFRPLRTKFQN